MKDAGTLGTTSPGVKPAADPAGALEFAGFQILLEESLKSIPSFWDATTDFPEDGEWVRQMVKDTRFVLGCRVSALFF